ncbi:hypothetical protein BHE74_00034642 [Ensete ventricosum]|nr:hypothetical protein BHE74_00034642 [Ensete ventricosum]
MDAAVGGAQGRRGDEACVGEKVSPCGMRMLAKQLWVGQFRFQASNGVMCLRFSPYLRITSGEILSSSSQPTPTFLITSLVGSFSGHHQGNELKNMLYRWLT